MAKPKINKELKTRKEFSYSDAKDPNVNLSFTLEVDSDKWLRKFKKLLVEALDDVQNEIDKFSN